MRGLGSLELGSGVWVVTGVFAVEECVSWRSIVRERERRTVDGCAFCSLWKLWLSIIEFFSVSRVVMLGGSERVFSMD